MLKVKHLQCTRDHQILFRDLTFSLKPGSCLQVYGRNGVGKSSLLRILAGLLKPCFGELEWDGRIVKFREFLSVTPDYQRDFIYIGHGLGLKMDLTPMENLQWWLGLRGVSMSGVSINSKNSKVKSEAVTQALQTLGMERWLNTKSSCLSAGLAKRLALARLKVMPARLWILDEPCNSLDVETQRWFGDLLHGHLSCGGIAVVSSHTMMSEISVNAGIQLLHLGSFQAGSAQSGFSQAGHSQENNNSWEINSWEMS